jgi:hypothetical protein
LNPIQRPPQAFANLLQLNTTASSVSSPVAVSHAFIRATNSAPTTPAKLTGLTAVIRAQHQPVLASGSPSIVTSSTHGPTITSAVVSASPALVQRSPATAVIQHHHATSPKVHIQAGQQQQVVLPVRTTPLTTQGNVTAAVTSVSFPVTSQHLTTPTLPNHPAGTIQTVKIGGGQAQVGKNSNILCCYSLTFSRIFS